MLLQRREGFALPMAILIIAFMTAGAAAAFSRADSEFRTVENEHAQTVAYAYADAGLAQFIATGSVPLNGTTQTVTYSQPLGTAAVTARRMRPSVGEAPPIWLISSVGTANAGANRPPAVRTVAQLAFRQAMTMQVLSTWTSLSGIHKNGASGDINGTDASGTACGDGATKPGVAVPTGGLTGMATAISGQPPVQPMGTQAEMASQIKIDWIGLTDPSGPVITPDVIRCFPGTPGYIAALGPCSSWPTSFAAWPTIIINGTASLPSNGQGTLIVTGDLVFGGNDQWNGIILVGGKITDNGSGHISGAVVSGLNVLKGMAVEESSKANGTKDYNYNSCDVQSAASGSGRVVQVPNAWIDNWSSW